VSAEAAVETCPRCGTFASLVQTDFTRVCASCVEAVRHPIQRTAGDATKLLAATWLVVREFGWLNAIVPLSMLVPALLFELVFPGSLVVFVISLVLSLSLVETVSFIVWRDRVLRRSAVDLRGFGGRLLVVLATNLVMSVVSTILAPLSFLYGPLSATVALSALEGRWPLDAIRTAWRRSLGQRVSLTVVYLVSGIPMVILVTVVAVGCLVLFASTSFAAAEVERRIVVWAVLVALSVGAVPVVVMQAAAWLATLPLPKPPENP
jgi:hypothetical protein